MEVSIIIVNYNTLQLTKNCIDSIRKNTTGIEYEIILVDNASTDGSKDFFEKERDIIYIYMPINLGFGNANNVGYEKAKGEYLFLLNSDTLLKNNAISFFLDYMKKYEKEMVACCGALLQDAEGNTIHSYGDFHTMTNSLSEWVLYPIKKRMGFSTKIIKYDRPYNWTTDHIIVEYITGADLFVKKAVVDNLGLFDPDFFMYYEDSELCKRLSDAGYKCMIIKEPQIIHLVGKSNNKNTLKKKEMVLKSMMLYMKKCFSPSYNIFFKIIFKFLYSICFFLSGKSLYERTKHIKNVLAL